MPKPDQQPLITHVNLARGFRGGERQTELLIREIAKTGYRQRLVARASEPLIVRLADLPALDSRPVGGILGAITAVRDSDLIHIHEGRGIQAAAIAHRLFGSPYIVTRRVMRPLKTNVATRSMYRHAAHLIGLSEFISEQLRQYVPEQQISTIPSALTPAIVDAERVRALRKAWGPQPVIGHVGALIADQKGQPMLVDIARERPQLTLVLVGSGKDESTLRQSAASLPNVIFAGQVDDVQNYLAAFDIFAFPSLFEGLGSILLDAMALGVPIIASNAGGIPDLIEHEVNGLLASPTDLTAWLSAVDRVLGTDALQLTFAKENQQRISQYSPAAMASRYHHLYEQLLT